jgi:hypothetical protein
MKQEINGDTDRQELTVKIYFYAVLVKNVPRGKPAAKLIYKEC